MKLNSAVEASRGEKAEQGVDDPSGRCGQRIKKARLPEELMFIFGQKEDEKVRSSAKSNLLQRKRRGRPSLLSSKLVCLPHHFPRLSRFATEQRAHTLNLGWISKLRLVFEY